MTFQVKTGILASGSVIININNLMNLFEDRAHSTVLTFKSYTTENGVNYDISSGSVTISNYDILSPSPFTSISMERSMKDLGQITTATITF